MQKGNESEKGNRRNLNSNKRRSFRKKPILRYKKNKKNKNYKMFSYDDISQYCKKYGVLVLISGYFFSGIYYAYSQQMVTKIVKFFLTFTWPIDLFLIKVCDYRIMRMNYDLTTIFKQSRSSLGELYNKVFSKQIPIYRDKVKMTIIVTIVIIITLVTLLNNMSSKTSMHVKSVEPSTIET